MKGLNPRQKKLIHLLVQNENLYASLLLFPAVRKIESNDLF